MEVGTLETLNIYPIKSCKGVSLSSVQIDEYGFANDRKFMIINGDKNRCITQRQKPIMALIAPTINEEKGFLEINAPNMPTLQVSLSPNGKIVNVGIWNDKVDAEDCGDEAAKWVTDFINQNESQVVPYRLVHTPKKFERRVAQGDYVIPHADLPAGAKSSKIALPDAAPFLLICTPSLDELNANLPEGEVKLPMKRFRPNFTVVGKDLVPFGEDYWKEIQIGTAKFYAIMKCARCKLTTIDPETGKFVNNQPLETLGRIRRSKEKKENLFFGQYFINDPSSVGNTISVGDKILVKEKIVPSDMPSQLQVAPKET